MPNRLTLGELADYTGYTEGTIYNYASRGLLPPHDELQNAHKSRPTKLWYSSTINQWLRDRGKS